MRELRLALQFDFRFGRRTGDNYIDRVIRNRILRINTERRIDLGPSGKKDLAVYQGKTFAVELQPAPDRIDFTNQGNGAAGPLLDIDPAIQFDLRVLVANPGIAMNIDG